MKKNCKSITACSVIFVASFLTLGLQAKKNSDHGLSCCEQKLRKNPFSTQNSQFPRYGHDNRNTFANLKETSIKKENIKDVTEKWNFVYQPVPGGIDWFVTQPVIVCGTVYLLSGLGYLYALDAQKGTLKPGFNGGKPVFVGIGAVDQNRGNAGSTPVVLGDFIYCATDDMFIRSFNRHTGELNPCWPATGVAIPVYPASFAPSYADALAQAAVQASLCIVDDGKDSLIFVTSINYTENTAAPLEKAMMTAYDLKGKLIWSEVIALANDDALGTGSWSTASFDTKNKLMFFGTSNAHSVPDNGYTDSLQVRNYKTGKLIWNYQYVSNDVYGFLYPFGIGNPVYLCDRDVSSSPNIFDVKRCGIEKQLVGASGKDGTYRAFYRTSGVLAWQTVLTNTPTVLGNPSAAYAHGVLYTAITSDLSPATATPIQAATMTGFIGCDNGTTPGSVLTVTAGTTQPLVTGQPITGNNVALGTIILALGNVNSDGTGTYIVNIIQAVPSTTLAGYPFSPLYGNTTGAPTEALATGVAGSNPNNPLYIPANISTTEAGLTSKGIVTALDAFSGKPLWKVSFPTNIVGTPIYANGIIFVGSYDGSIRALDAKDGTLLQTWTTPVQLAAPTPCSGTFLLDGLFPLPCNQAVPCLAVADGKIVVPYAGPFFAAYGGVIAFGL